VFRLTEGHAARNQQFEALMCAIEALSSNPKSGGDTAKKLVEAVRASENSRKDSDEWAKIEHTGDWRLNRLRGKNENQTEEEKSAILASATE